MQVNFLANVKNYYQDIYNISLCPSRVFTEAFLHHVVVCFGFFFKKKVKKLMQLAFSV